MADKVISLAPARSKRIADELAAPFKFTRKELIARTKKLDAAAIDKLPTLHDTDDKGLVCIRQAKGWTLAMQKKIRGKIYRPRYPELLSDRTNVESVRNWYRETLAAIVKGEFETAAETARKIEADRESAAAIEMTLGDCLAAHLKRNPDLRPKAIAFHNEMFRRTKCEDLKARDLDVAKVQEFYQADLANVSATTAIKTLRSLSALWNSWELSFGEHDSPPRSNPVKRIRSTQPKLIRKIAPRKSLLAEAHRRPWFDAAMARAEKLGEINNSSPLALAALFLTGARLSEITRLQWDEVDFDACTIALPPSRTKTGVEHVRPITPRLEEILRRRLAYNPKDCPFVFPAVRRSSKHDGPIPTGDPRKTINAINKAVGCSITAHDLRRTFIAAATAERIPSVSIKLLVGHSINTQTDEYAAADREGLPGYAVQIEDRLLGEDAA